AHVVRREAEFRGGRDSTEELVLANGHTVICTMTPLAGGRLLASYVDVTDMKTREADLADALEKARLAEAVINGLADPIFVKVNDLRFVLVNQSFSRLFGLRPDEMAGKVAVDFTPEKEAAGFEATERAVLDSGETY